VQMYKLEVFYDPVAERGFQFRCCSVDNKRTGMASDINFSVIRKSNVFSINT